MRVAPVSTCAVERWSRIGVYPAFMTQRESLIGAVSSSVIGHLHRTSDIHSLSVCACFKDSDKGSYISSGRGAQWPGWSALGLRLFRCLTRAEQGAEQGRPSEGTMLNNAAVRDKFYPLLAISLARQAHTSLDKAAGDKKESVVVVRLIGTNFIPSSCGNFTRRQRVASRGILLLCS